MEGDGIEDGTAGWSRPDDARLAAALRLGPEAVFLVDPVTAVVHWANDRVTDLSGWRPEDLVGRRIQELDRAVPADADTWRQVWEDVEPGGMLHFTGQMQCRDGSSRPVDVRLTVLEHHGDRVILAVARDVEVRVRVEKRLREREATLTAVIGALRDGVLVVDTEGMVTLANPRAAELAGRPLHRILDRHVSHVLPSHTDEHGNPIPPERMPLLRTLELGRAQHGLVHGTGEPDPRWLLVNTAPIVDDTSGEVQGAVATQSDITDLIRTRAELAELAAHDVLTGLPNRGRFHQRLVAAVSRGARTGDHLALLFLDLDGFKTVNDSLGHSHGDELLQVAGRRLRERLHEQDFVARIGGDEFVILMTRLGPDGDRALEIATTVAQRAVDVLGEPFALGIQTVRISASVGIALGQPGEADAEQLLRRADLAMYAAKEAGRSAHRVFEPHMDTRAQQAMVLDGDLRRAVERRDFVLHLQPRIDVRTGALAGAEALLRWPTERQDPVDASDIIAAAERNGLILPIGRWVLAEAVRMVERLCQEGVFGPGMTLSVNVSEQQLQHEDFLAELRQVVCDAGLPDRSLTLELTESSLVQDLHHAKDRLRAVAALGVPVAIDDFGTGYSSLAYLRELPVEEIKLDQSFVSALGVDPVAETIVEGVVGIADRLGITTVAEGVEHPSQLEFLAKAGCTLYQGFLAAPALSIDEFVARYRP